MKFNVMSDVQAATLPLTLQGADILAQAKTGTGKTLAFLIPCIQTIIRNGLSPHTEGILPATPAIRAVVISPTRELALQIAAEANQLTRKLEIRIHTSTGGTNINKDTKELSLGPDILVATPGRLEDHLSNPQLKRLFAHVQVAVLDEADNLLDQGFLPDLKVIFGLLPPAQQRQTLLFSATVPPEVAAIAATILRPAYAHVSTIDPTETLTHETVPQRVVTVPDMLDVPGVALQVLLDDFASASRQGAAAGFKAMVFHPTARSAQLYAELLRALSQPSRGTGRPTWPASVPIIEIHSRLSTTRRNAAIAEFRSLPSAVMVSSDLTARGMDFPDVTHVVQVGAPANREQYVHRVGRTGRAGKDGSAFMVLGPGEEWARDAVSDLNLVDGGDVVQRAAGNGIHETVKRGMRGVSVETKHSAYVAWLGNYKSHLRKMGWSPAKLVAEANRMALQGFMLDQVPEIWTVTAGKMGLKGTPGLRLTNVKKPRKEVD
ncbi:DEAD-domain-containing protein [Gonapodya prolifera JEL478]|uniref:ATP-dependent RNA helicase n=1 Tax=Gonapodya prolifera (strain JEL478) TaxID=1344416 RepID=A0A139AEN5_GONPJ|nr:DEAD-domain-containing protein [Gonapodya prolifera JEL478]|eukprot:KXS15237.1 DEAD-domain-containing protein [Gonapodya prolifera JEL478]